MKSFFAGVGIVIVAGSASLFAADQEHVAKFESSKRPESWSVNCGHWEPKDGVLVCRELKEDNHAAASRWQVPLRDGVIKLKLKFAGATAFHLGFDPAPGQLKKQGHLYSLVVTPTGASLKKHRDKADEKSKDEVLATATGKIGEDWVDVILHTEGDKVTASIGKSLKLEATDSTFHVAKPTVVFRVIGGDVHLDDVTVAVSKAGEPPAPAKSPAKPKTVKPAATNNP